jgi:uncharacterized membrane protein YdbT with pleckstrin-like domain
MTEAVDREWILNQLARLDTDWHYERQKHMLPDRYRRRYVPQLGMSKFFIVSGAIVSAISIPFFAFALFAGSLKLVHWMLAGISAYMIWFGLYSRRKAIDYQEAFADYLRRREELLERGAQ